MTRRPPRFTLSSSSAASDVYKRQVKEVGQKKKMFGVVVRFETRIEDGYEASTGHVVISELSGGNQIKVTTRSIDSKPSDNAWKAAEREALKSQPVRLCWINHEAIGDKLCVDNLIPKIEVQIQNSGHEAVPAKPGIGVQFKIFRFKPAEPKASSEPAAKKLKKSRHNNSSSLGSLGLEEIAELGEEMNILGIEDANFGRDKAGTFVWQSISVREVGQVVFEFSVVTKTGDKVRPTFSRLAPRRYMLHITGGCLLYTSPSPRDS
eukprot:TRINITY_DN45956_c0_g1_i1.p1 TRINITY_DN45956_c0_g1~~TRINITY_DN45956_c0_g1_i1.p1  ORF type:complete len:264 (+),score=78.96 TRINITY_DN45956_c0_g1_i1:41-832(+)